MSGNANNTSGGKSPNNWIIDRHRQQITALVLKESCYTERIYREPETIRSAAFPAFTVAVAQVLEGRELL